MTHTKLAAENGIPIQATRTATFDRMARGYLNINHKEKMYSITSYGDISDDVLNSLISKFNLLGYKKKSVDSV